MGKISELNMVISDLRTAAATINEVADTLVQMFSTHEDPAPAEVKQELTFDQVSNTLMAISRKSKEHSMKLRALVKKYGANKLSEISPAHYDAILEEAKVIADAE